MNVQNILIPMVILFIAGSCSVRTKKATALDKNYTEVIATLSGLNQIDAANENLRFELICENVELKYLGKKASSLEGTIVAFPITASLENRFCNLAVRGDAAYRAKWLSTPPDPGLFYSASKAQITSGSLSFELVQLYRDSEDDNT